MTPPTMPALDIDAIASDFELLDDWEDRYRYVIELGRKLAPLPPGEKTDTNKVRGCASQVWLVTTPVTEKAGETRLDMAGESDSHIVQGLMAILLAMTNGKAARELVTMDIQGRFNALGLNEHLTPQRSNGLASMVERIKVDARQAAATR